MVRRGWAFTPGLLLGLALVHPAAADEPAVAADEPAAATAEPAAAADEPAVFPDIQRILDAGVIRVAIRARDAAPMIMTDAEGELAGSEPDLARDLARKLGVAVKFLRSAESYDGVVDLVARKDADIAISYLSGGVQRARHVFFSRPYIRQSGRLVYNRAQFAKLKRAYGIDGVRDIRGTPAANELQVGVIAGSVYETNLERDFPASRLQRFDDLREMMAAVRRGETFAALHGGLQVDYFMRRHPATAIYVAVDPDIRQPSDIRIAVRPDAPHLLRWVDLYLSDHVGMQDDSEIVRRYLDWESDLE
jgi:ABC-type amino acid transport substrate-binding protein